MLLKKLELKEFAKKIEKISPNFFDEYMLLTGSEDRFEEAKIIYDKTIELIPYLDENCCPEVIEVLYKVLGIIEMRHNVYKSTPGGSAFIMQLKA